VSGQAEPDDRELVERAVRNALRNSRVGRTRWGCVMETFAVGSRTARGLCIRHGLDPDESRVEEPL